MRKQVIIFGLGVGSLWQAHSFAPLPSLRAASVLAPLSASKRLDEVDVSLAKAPSNSTQEVFAANNDSDGTMSLSAPSARSSSQPNSFATWKRRLITREDPFSFHKLASISYTVSSAALLGTAAIQALRGDFATIPPSIEPVMHIFTISNLVMCSASVRMAFLYHQGDIPTRNAFLGTAVSSLFSGYFLVWISPFPAGDIFYNTQISQFCFAVIVVLNAYFIGDGLLKREELVEGRRDKKAEEYKGRVFVDTLGYILPGTVAMVLVALTMYLASIAHDRVWFLEQCKFIDQSVTGSPGMRSHIFYQQLATSLAASYASFFVTLRDKKLISKNQELAGIASFSFPAVVWSVYTPYYFIASLFMET